MSGKVGDKGYTGNPGGRPKMPEELRRAFQETSSLALATLKSILDGSDDTAKSGDRIRAAEVLLYRAWGKPVQSVEADVHDTRTMVDTSKLTDDQRAAIVALAVASIETDES